MYFKYNFIVLKKQHNCTNTEITDYYKFTSLSIIEEYVSENDFNSLLNHLEIKPNEYHLFLHPLKRKAEDDNPKQDKKRKITKSKKIKKEIEVPKGQKSIASFFSAK